VIGNAGHIMPIAAGEIEEGAFVDDGRELAAVAPGRKARAAKLSKRKWAEIAKNAASAWWGS
jgi:hypothetical protein